MELESSTLAIESFSDSWLTSSSLFSGDLEETLSPPVDNVHGGATIKEPEHRLMNLKRHQEDHNQNFHFDVPMSLSPDAFVHADQIFSDGLIKPAFASQSRREAHDNSLSPGPDIYSPSISSKSSIPVVDVQCDMLGRWRKSSEKILRKCFGYFRPIRSSVANGSKRNRRVDDVDRRSWEVKSWSSSVQATPRRSAAYSSNDWSDSESSIYEAVLHCKRSIN